MSFFIVVISLFIGIILNFIIHQKIIFYQKSFFIITITSLLFLISYYHFGYSSLLIKALTFDCILIVVSFIDLEHQIIPNKIIMVILALGLVFSFVDDLTLLSAITGMMVGGGLLFLLALVPKGMGGGDVKFMFALGIFLGLKKVLIGLYISFIVGGIVSLILILLKKKNKKEHIPFGPILSIGSFIAYHFFN